jgi:Tol biopolymer transport system component
MIASDPFVDPDERYILFTSGNEEGGYGIPDILISFRYSDDTWGEPINLGSSVNTNGFERFPSISPDGKYMFFIRAVGTDFSGNQNYYWISTRVIDSLKTNR